MKKFKEYLNERVSDIVYHSTSLLNAIDILKNNKFELSTALGTSSDLEINRGKYYFFSTARTLTSQFIQKIGVQDVVFKLDGRKLSQRYKGVAVDYWSGFGDHKQQSEAEDRIVTDESEIPNADKYIISISMVKPNEEDLDRFDNLGRWIRELNKAAKGRNVELIIYENLKALLTQNKKKTVEPARIYSNLPQLSKLIDWIEGKAPHSKDFYDVEYMISRYPNDYRTIEGDIHNDKNNPFIKPIIKKITQYMKKYKLKNIKEMVFHIHDRLNKIK